MIAAILLATAAAAVFAAGTSLQHRAASAVPQAGTSAAGLLVLLAHQPSWLAGLGLSAAAGVSFVLIAGLLKMLSAQVQGGFPALLGQWSLWAMLSVGAGALLGLLQLWLTLQVWWVRPR